jgi:hypothetical protein
MRLAQPPTYNPQSSGVPSDAHRLLVALGVGDTESERGLTMSNDNNSCGYCASNCPHDTETEGRAHWLDHYMSIPAADLAASYALNAQNDDSEVSDALEAAFDERREEIGDKWMRGEL